MARVAPDGYDVFVLFFNDAAGTHTNTGTAGSLGNFVDYGSPVSGATGLYGDALYIPSAYLTSNHEGSGGANDILVTPTISMSGWVYVRRQTNFFAECWNKQYFLSGWSSPFLTFGMQMDSGNDGGWTWYITTGSPGAGTLKSMSIANNTSNRAMLMTSGRWYHLGGTWDGTTLTLYLNGVLIGTSVPGGGAIDYGTAARGQWYTGSIPGSSTNQGGPFIIQDLRIANIVRPASYFANIWYKGMFVNG